MHAFDDLQVMAGNGTIGLEILEDLPDVDAVVIPWGGGGLASGIGAAVRALAPGCRILAAEAETGAPLAAALAAGAPVTVDYRPTFVDGIGSRSVFPQMLARAQALLDGSLVSTLDEIAAATAASSPSGPASLRKARAPAASPPRSPAAPAAARSSAWSRAATSISDRLMAILGGRRPA